MKKHNDGSAFPLYGVSSIVCEGMSLRDYFAGQAINGLAANPGGPWQANSMSGWALANCKLDEVTEIAYQIADAMLVERSKP